MKILLCIYLTSVFVWVGCGNDKNKSTDTSGNGVENPSFSQDIQPILNAHCTGCHGSSFPNGGYSLTSYEGITGKGSDDTPNVIAGKPSESYMYQRVESGVMPPGADRLSSEDVATIRNWIEQGAQNN